MALVAGRARGRLRAGDGEVQAAAVRAQVERAGGAVERHPSALSHGGHADPYERGGALQLRADEGDAPVGAEGAVVRLGHRHPADDPVAGGVDEERLIGAPSRHQHELAVGSHGQTV
jgi:hypothetical protein